MLRILNLGAGVQSTTVLLISIHGENPKLDHIVFADTGSIPSITLLSRGSPHRVTFPAGRDRKSS